MFNTETIKAIAVIARDLDVPTAALLAVAEVESGGQTLVSVNGRKEPLIRFEGHYFDRCLRGEARIKARKAGLASPLPGRVRNPRQQLARWKKLDRAIAINRVAALSSCSWGLGQVMGAHWKWLGYGSVDALVDEARSDVVGQIRLMARYIEKAGLCEALRSQNWQKFARTYNGPGYAKNRYDMKMAQAFERHRKTALHHDLPVLSKNNEEKLMFGARGKAVKALQKRLCRLGYLLRCDGLFGLITDRTVRTFQRDHNLKETGIIGKADQYVLDGGMSVVSLGLLNARVAVSKAYGVKGRRWMQDVHSRISGLHKRALSLFRRFA